LLLDAVGRALKLGDAALARELLGSKYYPRSARTLKRAAQRFCAAVPLGPQLYQALVQLRGRLRTAR
jgi:hypothetical protein